MMIIVYVLSTLVVVGRLTVVPRENLLITRNNNFEFVGTLESREPAIHRNRKFRTGSHNRSKDLQDLCFHCRLSIVHVDVIVDRQMETTINALQRQKQQINNNYGVDRQ